MYISVDYVWDNDLGYLNRKIITWELDQLWRV